MKKKKITQNKLNTYSYIYNLYLFYKIKNCKIIYIFKIIYLNKNKFIIFKKIFKYLKIKNF